jgi:glucose-6-phosphate dehydrogenase assembly protein OpcA
VIIDLPDTTTGALNRKLVDLRESGGAVALGRVLTLVVITEEGYVETAIDAANDASREHPCRVITVGLSNRRGAPRLDAQIRVGGDAGASEVIVLRLYGPLTDHADSVVIPLLLPDAPIVVWWPGESPPCPAEHPIGVMAHRRITDAAAAKNPIKALQQRSAGHRAGDTDLAWSRVTLWRALLAAALDQPPFEPVHSATVTGSSDSPSTDLLAAWLTMTLRCPVRRARTRVRQGLLSVQLERSSGPILLERPDGVMAHLTQPGQPERKISMPPRPDRDCLAEELRRLDPDDVFREVITKGFPMYLDAASKAKAPATAKKAGARKAVAEKAKAGA